MVKTIFKEIVIFLLLLLVIILILGILFYDYVPTSKTVPVSLKSYELSDETKSELEETMVAQGSQNIVKTYSIDQSDLSVYKSSKNYDNGKVNPFEDYTTESSNSQSNNIQNNNIQSNNKVTNNTITNNVSSRDNEVYFTGGKNQ